MHNISDLIEQHLKALLAASAEGFIEIQRNELAGRFNCVPSQINYVLATRFTLERGFLIESRRGGGGYVRIMRLNLDRRLDLVAQLCDLAGGAVSQQRAEDLIRRLLDEELITNREARLMLAAVSREALRVGLPARDQLRALILKSMLISLLRINGKSNGVL
ncbi:CtsR family transcriptional regulator [Desulfotomaculum copahuensis]|uniref:Transcriptional regulator CtsR n=1 Tax=Desulfotomaculum copahuensis TaxID=1838280 RepID=A0A1B7LGF0_9FIRM|nr:CtsR family transcriptional regulator [Desulfotomaculum copahuensis]OAT85181.1 transcriptional regulator [Desulfotomaculum copahuensis]